MTFISGLGHYDAVGDPCRVQGDIDGVKVVYMSSKGDCVLALSGESSVNLIANCSQCHHVIIVVILGDECHFVVAFLTFCEVAVDSLQLC